MTRTDCCDGWADALTPPLAPTNSTRHSRHSKRMRRLSGSARGERTRPAMRRDLADCERCLEVLDQQRFLEWLAQEADRAGFEHAAPDAVLGERRDEDDR